MYSVSMTTRLGLAAVLGAIAIVVIADGKDQAPVTCKGETCANGQVMSKKIPKSAQQTNRSTDRKAIGLAPGDSPTLYGAAMANTKFLVKSNADKPVSKKPAPTGSQEFFVAVRREIDETDSQ